MAPSVAVVLEDVTAEGAEHLAAALNAWAVQEALAGAARALSAAAVAPSASSASGPAPLVSGRLVLCNLGDVQSEAAALLRRGQAAGCDLLAARLCWADTLRPVAPAAAVDSTAGADGAAPAPPPLPPAARAPEYARAADALLSEAPALDPTAAAMDGGVPATLAPILGLEAAAAASGGAAAAANGGAAAAPAATEGTVEQRGPGDDGGGGGGDDGAGGGPDGTGGAAAAAPAAAAAAAAAATTPTPRRPWLGSAQCFNCGSYQHRLADCDRPRDAARTSASLRKARAAAAAGSTGNGGDGGGGGRYFEAGPLERLAQRADGGAAAPGAVSAALAAALGMASPLDPPPWLGRLVALGVPPGYGGGEGSGDDDDGNGSGSDDSGSSGIELFGDDDGSGSSSASGEDGLGGNKQEGGRSKEEGDDAETSSPAAQVNGRTDADAVRASRRRQRRKQAVRAATAAAVVLPGLTAPPPDGADADKWREALASAYATLPPAEAHARREALLAADAARRAKLQAAAAETAEG